MVFSSIPGYLDPSNWQQQHQQHHLQQNHQSGFQHGINISSNSISINSSSLTNPNPLLPSPPLPPPQQPRAQPPPHTGPMSASSSLIRPGSMAERARMANIPMPEVALKCPRCESTNTKFCYFNNYSLSQPRHFCKTCRRYWTRGGALRSVPVGGGCRRNKRSKSTSSNSKSSATSGGDRERSSSTAAATSSASSAGGNVSQSHSSMAEMMGFTSPPSQLLSSLRFMTPLHHLTDFGDQLGLSSYGTGDSGFHLGGIGSGGAEQWRILNPPGPTQFPFLGGMDIGGGSSLYGHHPLEGVEFSNLAIGGNGGPLRASKAEEDPTTEMVKVEERGNEEMRLVRGYNMGMNNNINHENGEEQYNNWGGNGSNSSGNGWTDLSALNNSSCSTTSAL